MSGFANSIIGGMSKLIRAAIQSPNYVLGSLGWTINKDGSAEFNNVTVRGIIASGTFKGNNFILNNAGLFIYSGTPALGNLVFSLTQAAGTDGFGNAYPASLSIGLATQVQVRLALNGSNAGFLMFGLNSASFVNGIVEGAIIANGGNPYGQMLVNGPAHTGTFKDFYGIELNSSDGTAANAQLLAIYNDTAGAAHIQAQFDFQGLHVWSTLWGTGGVLTVGDNILEQNLSGYKPTFTTYSSTTLTADASLIVNVQANAVYRFECMITYFSSIANTNLSLSFTPTGAGGHLYLATTTQGGTFNWQDILGLSQTLNNPVASTNYAAQMSGILTTGSVTQVQLYFAKVANTSINVNAGSHMKLTRIA
jgi:hypothetical protein